MIWSTLSQEVGFWAARNFPSKETDDRYNPLLGIVEELGELSQAVVNKDKEAIRDALADITIYMADYAYRNQLVLGARGHTVAFGGESYILPLTTTVGKLCHHHLKQKQGIRGTAEEHQIKKQWCIDQLLSQLEMVCAFTLDQSLVYVVTEVWRGVVSKRDWVENKEDGKIDIANTLATEGPQMCPICSCDLVQAACKLVCNNCGFKHDCSDGDAAYSSSEGGVNGTV